MTPHTHTEKTPVPTFPDARSVGRHLVVDRAEWIPGFDPETRRDADGRRSYADRHLRCIRCGEAHRSERDFSEECTARRGSDRRCRSDSRGGDAHRSPPEVT